MLASFAAGNAIRLVSTLILTRLLFPEVFGTAALIGAFILGLALLSDIGIEQGVIQSKRGDEEAFLNTAWTMQVLRGVALWLISCLISWPLARLYGQPELLYLLPAASSAVLLKGLTSTSFVTLRRSVSLLPITMIEVASQVVGLIITILWALWRPSVWALIVGNIASTAIRTTASHLLRVGSRNRFHWDTTAISEIFHFGKWIFGSSALFFFSQQADRLLLAKYLGAAALGIYSIALMISEVIAAAVTQIMHGVMFPILSKVQRENPSGLSSMYYKTRLSTDALALIPVGGLMMMSQSVIDVLYDSRYAEAGWMLQLLCIRAAMSIVLVPAETCLFCMGRTRYGFYQNVGKSIWVLLGIPVAWRVAGLEGVVWCVALSQIPVAIILFFPLQRLGLLRWSREMLAVVFFMVGAALGAGADMMFRALFPGIFT